MLALEHITLQYGARRLFDDVSCMVSPHDRIGLVGSNGAGKSTLLRIVSSLQGPDSGNISKAQYVSVGYLPQDGITAVGRTLYKEAETAFEDIVAIQGELEQVEQSLTTLNPEQPEYSEALEIFGELHHKLEDLDAFRMKSKIESVLMGLGFTTRDFERATDEFSGGWQMRIALAKLLLKEPSLLLLDEPTNHLDLDSLEWLEEYLSKYIGGVILVSHDRAFLDSLCTKIFALSKGALEEYSGNYSFYEKERIIRKELLLNRYKNQQQQLKHTQEFIDRFRYKASKARQVQSRIKQMEKTDFIELDEDEEEIHFRFPQPQQSGRVVAELSGVAKQYGDNKVFSNLEYKIERMDKIAVVGVNGAGKSTFSRIVAGVEPFDRGTRELGYNVILSYFAQHQAEELDLSKEVLETVDEVAEGEVRKKLRSILGSFLFHGDDVFKKVGVLSGGEKSRLALAKMLLRPANFLVMDEPTNHLDMRSKKVLQEALQHYEGSFVIVSHDKAFLDPIVNKVLEVRHGSLRTYLGNVSDYLAKKKTEGGNREATIDGPRPKPPLNVDLDLQQKRSPESQRRKQILKKIQPLKKKRETMERKIELLEKQKGELERSLASPALYREGNKAGEISLEYKQVQDELNNLYYQWGELSERITSDESHLEQS